MEEYKEIRQRENEGYRRYFYDDKYSLMVWLNHKDGNITGFQIAYDKNNNEKVITYKDDEGRKVRSHRFVTGTIPYEHGSSMTSILKGNAGEVRCNVIKDIEERIKEIDIENIKYIIDGINSFKGKDI